MYWVDLQQPKVSQASQVSHERQPSSFLLVHPPPIILFSSLGLSSVKINNPLYSITSPLFLFAFI